MTDDVLSLMHHLSQQAASVCMEAEAILSNDPTEQQMADNSDGLGGCKENFMTLDGSIGVDGLSSSPGCLLIC